MSQENVRLAYRGHETFNRRDLDAFLEQMHAESEFMPYEVAANGGAPYKGLEGMGVGDNDRRPSLIRDQALEAAGLRE